MTSTLPGELRNLSNMAELECVTVFWVAFVLVNIEELEKNLYEVRVWYENKNV